MFPIALALVAVLYNILLDMLIMLGEGKRLYRVPSCCGEYYRNFNLVCIIPVMAQGGSARVTNRSRVQPKL